MSEDLFRRLTGQYVDAINPKDRGVLERMTAPSNWDSSKFTEVMVALAKVGRGNAVPAGNAPKTLHLQAIRPLIDTLVSRTRETNREHARVFFADIEKAILVGGKTTIGSESSAHLDFTKQTGREKLQKAVLTVHTHPDDLTSHGLSGTDYRTFMSDPEQQAMMIAYGSASRLMVLKTSVTPNNTWSKDSDVRLRGIEAEFMPTIKKNPLLGMVAFNKTVCLELGLTMYLANETSNDLFERVNVTQIK